MVRQCLNFHLPRERYHVVNDHRYALNQDYQGAQTRMALLPSYYAWTISKFKTFLHGCVLDLGSGRGLTIPHYIAQVDRVIAVDHDPRLLNAIRGRYPPGIVETRMVDFISDWSPLNDVRADIIIALDILEHFENDREFVERALQRLRPNGFFCIKVPAQQRLFCSADDASGHFRRYEPPQLTKLFTDAGCREVMQQFLNPVGAWVYRWKRKKRTNFSRQFPRVVLRVVNRAIPALALLDHVQFLKGLSLVAVYRKD